MIINAKLSIGFPSACRTGEIDIPDEDLAGLSPEAQENMIQEWLKDWAFEYIEWSYEQE